MQGLETFNSRIHKIVSPNDSLNLTNNHQQQTQKNPCKIFMSKSLLYLPNSFYKVLGKFLILQTRRYSNVIGEGYWAVRS